ncbi:MAG TPA: metal-dependent hydrolase [Solirubrobacteraceae bacterium]|nr:metal-dependent hydrolase [Solirubrobacteraceae bacterium]
MSPYPAWPFLSDPSHPLLSAVWAVAIHGVICLAAIAPIVWRSRRRALYAALAFVGGSAIDLDHFIAAGSLNLHTIETMSGRPDTHSLIFAVALALLALALTRQPLAGWSVFAVTVAHLLFDAAGGSEHFFYPFSALDGLPWIVCPIGTVALALVSAVIAAAAMEPPQRAAASRATAVS